MCINDFFFPIIGAEDCWRERHISQWMQRNNILYFLGNAACYHAVVMLRGLTMRSSVLAARLSHRSIVVIRSLEIFLLFRIWLAVWFCSPLTGWHRHNPHESHEHRCTSDHFVDLNKNTAERQEWRDEKKKKWIWYEKKELKQMCFMTDSCGYHQNWTLSWLLFCLLALMNAYEFGWRCSSTPRLLTSNSLYGLTQQGTSTMMLMMSKHMDYNNNNNKNIESHTHTHNMFNMRYVIMYSGTIYVHLSVSATATVYVSRICIWINASRALVLSFSTIFIRLASNGFWREDK